MAPIFLFKSNICESNVFKYMRIGRLFGLFDLFKSNIFGPFESILCESAIYLIYLIYLNRFIRSIQIKSMRIRSIFSNTDDIRIYANTFDLFKYIFAKIECFIRFYTIFHKKHRNSHKFAYIQFMRIIIIYANHSTYLHMNNPSSRMIPLARQSY